MISRRRTVGRILTGLALLLGTASAARANVILTLNYTGGITPSQQIIFNNARNTWQNVLTGYAPGVTLTGFTIDASGPAIDGPGGILGSAGPTLITNQGGFTYTTAGQMQFDSADLGALETSGALADVVLHEMGHVLGIGTLWTNNNLYVNNSGNYTGAFGLAAYRTEFNQPAALAIPVELGGGPGTANGHWNEVDFGAGLTGIVDGMGRDMRNELMTGWLNAPTFMSNMTQQSMRDLGYTVAPIPEPSTFALVGLAAGCGWIGRRRAKRAA